MMSITLNDFLLDAAKILISVLCAALIGWEREKHEKAAGLRTHMLICLGSCLATIVAFRSTNPDMVGQAHRVTQGILTGIGFVGAGTIFREGHSVQGITTAAGIWVVAAIGIAVGTGDLYLALFTTILMYFIMKYLVYHNQSK